MSSIFLLKERYEVFCIFKSFIIKIKTQFGSILRLFALIMFLNLNILPLTSTKIMKFNLTIYVLIHSNKIKVVKKYLPEVTHTIMFQFYIASKFWRDAILTACHLFSRSLFHPSKQNSHWNYLSMKTIVFHPTKDRCICFVHILETSKDKFAAYYIKYAFLDTQKIKKLQMLWS